MHPGAAQRLARGVSAKQQQALAKHPPLTERAVFENPELCRKAFYADAHTLIFQAEVREALAWLKSAGLFVDCIVTSRSKLEGLLWALAWVCAADRAGKSDEDFLKECQAAGKAQDEGKFSPETLANTKPRYPMSFDKVMRMWRKLVRDQFVTFAEA